jgi:hypothetical protein
MELRHEEDDPEEQSKKRYPLCLARHAYAKTELRLKWLRGQAAGGSFAAFSAIFLRAGCRGARRFAAVEFPAGAFRTSWLDAAPARRLQWWWSGTSKQVRERKSFEPMRNL